MNVKCISTSVTVCPLIGRGYERDLSEYITIGNVYKVSEDHGDRYRIMHDHGDMESLFPTYLFDKTDEPVTENPNRNQEIKSAADQQRKLVEEQEQQRIADNMEKYYNPGNFQRIEAERTRRRNIISRTFVGGLPY